MKLDDLTIGEARQIRDLLGTCSKACPFEVGSAYFIRTVTMFWLGRVVKIVGDFIVMEDAAWIADTGRFHQADSPEKFNEVEPVKGRKVFIGMGSIVDAQEWTAKLATEPR